MDDREITESMKSLVETMNASVCEVFCIMDYWTFDWYHQLQDYLKRPDAVPLQKTVFPWIELRVDSPTKIRMNIHAILSDTLQKDQLNDFISHLRILVADKTLTLNKTNIIKHAKTYSDDKAQRQWYGPVNTLNDDQLLELWQKTIVITKGSLHNALNVVPPHEAFMMLPYDTYHWFREINWENHMDETTYFLGKSDFFETRNQKVADLFAGVRTPGNEEFIENFTKAVGKPKPCLSWSDAHQYRDYGKFPNNKATRVKAEPTFEWLKQMIYEPSDRVKISLSQPDQKESYQLIDSVKFVDDQFLPQEIPLNQNLVVIIGGKSTWKSILLRNIAASIDPEQVAKRLNEAQIDDYESAVWDFHVTRKDGQIDTKSNQRSEKKIIYIPQSYLNRLVDKWAGKTQINEIIKRVIIQEERVEQTLISIEEFIRNNEKLISSQIDDLFYLINDVQQKNEEIKNIGDEKWIRTEIEILQKDVDTLKELSSLTDDELTEYQTIKNDIAWLTKTVWQLKEDVKIIRNECVSYDLFNVLDVDWLSDEASEEIEDIYEVLKNDSEIKWKQKMQAIIDDFEERIKNTKEELVPLEEKKVPLQQKVNESEELQQKMKVLEWQQQKLEKITEEKNKLDDFKNKSTHLINELINNYKRFHDTIFEKKSDLLSQTTIWWWLDFDIRIVFNEISFQRDFLDPVCNARNFWKFTDVDLADFSYTNQATLFNDIENILKWVLSGKIKLKTWFDKKNALRRLLDNRFFIDYQITQDGDTLARMSPGKKSFVLLRLLIELDNSKCPILLDQPEDDLDNTSIYKELVAFIKEKKKTRQIILVTHNPNLVVWADAEQVIVANQDWVGSSNKQYKFEYVSWPIEQTFSLPEVYEKLYASWIQEHVCDTLEWWKDAFTLRKQRYKIDE